MLKSETELRPPRCGPIARNAKASLKVLRVIGGRAGSEYWTMRCTRCGGIHLDIVKGSSPSPSPAA